MRILSRFDRIRRGNERTNPEPETPARFTEAVPMKSIIIYNSGPVKISGWQPSLWVNPTNAMFLHKTYLWIGIDYGEICDTHLDLRYHNQEAPIDILQWDHYEDPIQPVGRWTPHIPPFHLDAGQELDIWHLCSDSTINGHFYIVGHYTDDR